MSQRFSRRHGPFRNDPAIEVLEDAPSQLRTAVVALTTSYNMDFLALLRRMDRVLRRPVSSEFRGFPDTPVAAFQRQLEGCTWSTVYDIIEEIYDELGVHSALAFESEINDFLRQSGIGYQMIKGQIEHRGDDSFESTARKALKVTDESNLDAAHRELSEALDDLSKRPKPDLTGAISHAMSAWLSVARAIDGHDNANPSDILKRNPDMMPGAMTQAIKSVWGYSSQYGRKVNEGMEPTYDEAAFVVHVSAAAATYLVRKSGLVGRDPE